MTRPMMPVTVARRTDQTASDRTERMDVATTTEQMRAQMADWTAARRARLAAQGKDPGAELDLDALRDGRIGRRRA